MIRALGELPVILMEINVDNPSSPQIAKSYIYANGQILAKHDGGIGSPRIEGNSSGSGRIYKL